MTTDKIEVHHTLEIICVYTKSDPILGHVCSYYSFVNIGIHLFGRGKHRKSNFCWQPNFKIYTKMAQFQNHSLLAPAGIFSDITKWAHKFHWSISASLKYVALVIQFNMVKAHIFYSGGSIYLKSSLDWQPKVETTFMRNMACRRLGHTGGILWSSLCCLNGIDMPQVLAKVDVNTV